MNDKALVWVSCSAEINPTVSPFRHIARVGEDGWTDTLCGATGTPGAFHRDSKKPRCETCLGAVTPNQRLLMQRRSREERKRS